MARGRSRPQRTRPLLGLAARGLLVGSPREVLARLFPRDPLRVRALVAERLAARYLLMDGERVFLASLARIARGAARYRGSPPLAAWIEREVDAAIDALRAEEARRAELEAEEQGPARAPDDGRERCAWRALAPPLGLAPEAMRAACARFNALPLPEREAFVRVVLERRSPDALARESGSSLSELARRARRGIEAVLAPLDEARSARHGNDGRGARPAADSKDGLRGGSWNAGGSRPSSARS